MTAPLLAAVTADAPPWMGKSAPTALCAEADPELWFPPPGDGRTSRMAKQLCQRCPLLTVCRSWALEHPREARHGVWGGLTEQERRAERRRCRGWSESTGEAA